jgi:threonine/homoserine/homoserine lactone efflux protein
MDSTSLFLIFSLSFLTALTGAMSPGPLFTYTIIKAISNKKRGWIMGFAIILGHAILELVIITVLLLGLSAFLNQPTVLITIGILGCGLLFFFGITLIRDVLKNKVPIEFLENAPIETKPLQINSKTMVSSNQQVTSPNSNGKTPRVMENPVLGGIFVSMSNPYWWFWWVAVGFAFMIQYNITFQAFDGFLAFFFGHEMGDLVWYVFVAILASLGKRALNKKVYYGILVVCGCFMIGFGLYLGISSILQFS